MARTRSKGGAATNSKKSTTESSSSSPKSRYALPAESTNPPQIFILPKKATKEARIVLLLNPRYAKPTRYLVCPETGVYELTRIAAPKSTPRSWLIQYGSDNENGAQEVKLGEEVDSAEFGVQITKGADLFVATPIDPIFLLLPAFTPATSASTDSKSERQNRLFVSSDDHLDTIQQSSLHQWEILRWSKVRALFESRMAAICDTAQAGDETMFRFSEDKLLAELLAKARRMSEGPLPKSMEDKFVTKTLEAPVVGVKRVMVTQTQTETAETDAVAVVESGTPTPKEPDYTESQSSAESTETSASEASTAATSVTAEESTITTTTTTTTTEEATSAYELAPTMQASPEVIRLQRLRTAFQFLCSSYIAPDYAAALKKKLLLLPPGDPSGSGVDFSALDAYLARLAQLRHEAATARSAGDYTRKRVLDEEEVAARAEKKRRRDDEDKRKKAGESRGVRDLKKVSTVGMRKMSDFFKKK
ncbi:ribonuclease H2, subunit B [Biscogniauxia marginata]|nr:ribonuclease H2, subunit B [Biscogniauxia marginata]